MKFSQMLKEDFSFLLYNQIMYTNALYHRIPFKVIQYDSDKNTNIILFSESRTGSTISRHITLSKEDAVFFRSWLASDFPNLEIETIEGDVIEGIE